MTMPPPSGGYPAGSAPLRGTRPKEVEISFWLWIAVLVFSALGVVITFFQIDRVRTEAINELLAQNPTMDRSLIESAATAGLIVGIMIGLLFVVAEFVFAFLMRGGRNWARIVLAVLGGLGVLLELVGLVGTAGAVGLLQLLLLSAAIVTMFLPPANAWFRPPRPEF